jgi:hypothetical protein
VAYPVYVRRRSEGVQRPWTGLSGEADFDSSLGSFTEVCSVVSEGRTGLGKAWLAGLWRQGLGWPRTRRARVNGSEVELQ